MNKDEYFTFNEYMKREDNSLTASLEDYLEMIYRLSLDTGFIRINELADALNVQPSSVTKAVQKLAEQHLVDYERYGIVILNEPGKVIGKTLLKRHNMIKDFLKLIGVADENLLKETEKIEHTISDKTVRLFECLLAFMNNRTDIIEDLKAYQQKENIF